MGIKWTRSEYDHQSSFWTQGRPVTANMKSFLAVVALVGIAQSVQGVSPTGSNPTYFVAPLSAQSAEDCEAYYDAHGEGITGPIFTPPGKLTICIFFPAPHNIWRLDTGSQGNCRGDCCEWFPPSGNDGTPALKTPPPTIAWFASLDGTCDNEAAAELTPWIFTDAPPGDYEVCMKPGPADKVPAEFNKFFKVPVQTSVCGGLNNACCPFNFPDGYKPPFAKKD